MTQSNYCGLPGILPGVTDWCMTCLNTDASTVLMDDIHIGTALEPSLVGPHCHSDNLDCLFLFLPYRA